MQTVYNALRVWTDELLLLTLSELFLQEKSFIYFGALASSTGSVEAEPLFDCFVLLFAVVQCRRNFAQDGRLVKYAQD